MIQLLKEEFAKRKQYYEVEFAEDLLLKDPCYATYLQLLRAIFSKTIIEISDKLVHAKLALMHVDSALFGHPFTLPLISYRYHHHKELMFLHF